MKPIISAQKNLQQQPRTALSKIIRGSSIIACSIGRNTRKVIVHELDTQLFIKNKQKPRQQSSIPYRSSVVPLNWEDKDIIIDSPIASSFQRRWCRQSLSELMGTRGKTTRHCQGDIH